MEGGHLNENEDSFAIVIKLEFANEEEHNDTTVNSRELLHTEEEISLALLPTKKDYFALLPQDVAMVVFGHLKPGDLLKAAQTSKNWRKLGEDNLLWKNKCEEAGVTYCLNYQNEEALKRWTKNSAFKYSVWKASFLKSYRIDKNFRTIQPELIKVRKCHTVHGLDYRSLVEYMRISVLDNMIVYSTSNAIYVSSALTGKTLRKLVGHTGPVMDIHMDKHFIVSGGTDNSVRVWNIDTGECMHILKGHTSQVSCLHLHAGIVVSGSRDTTLRMWDVERGQFLRRLMGHWRSVECVQYTGNLVVSGSEDAMVKVWDPERGQCLRTLSGHGHTSRIYSLRVEGDLVFSKAWNSTINVWEVNTGVLRYTLNGCKNGDYGENNFQVLDNVMVGIVPINNRDYKCKIWNNLTGSLLQMLNDANKYIGENTEIQLNSKFVVTSSFDEKVRLWDVKTGEFIRDLLVLEGGAKVWKIWMEDAKIVCAVLFTKNNVKKLKIGVLNLDNFDINDIM